MELTKDYLDRIKAIDSKVRAIVTITEEHALQQASKADEAIAHGESNPLTGIPFLLKDNMSTKGIKPPAPRRCWKTLYPRMMLLS